MLILLSPSGWICAQKKIVQEKPSWVHHSPSIYCRIHRIIIYCILMRIIYLHQSPSLGSLTINGGLMKIHGDQQTITDQCWLHSQPHLLAHPGVKCQLVVLGSQLVKPHVAMDQYLLIPFLGGWTSINPSYFDVNYRGTIGFDTLPYVLGMLKLAKAFDFYMLLFASSWRQHFFQWIWGWLKTKTVPLVLCCSPQVIAGIYGCE